MRLLAAVTRRRKTIEMYASHMHQYAAIKHVLVPPMQTQTHHGHTKQLNTLRQNVRDATLRWTAMDPRLSRPIRQMATAAHSVQKGRMCVCAPSKTID